MNKNQEKDTLGALILVAVGIILLLNNFGILPWSVWNVLFKFWPLILISVGLKTAFGEKSIIYTLSTILLFFSIFYSITLVSQPFDNWVERQIPQWKEFKNKIPGKVKQESKRKIFRCDPITGECQSFYR